MIEREIHKVLKNKFTDSESQKEKLITVLFLAQKHLNKNQLKSVEIKFIKSTVASGKCYKNAESIGLEVTYCLQRTLEEIETIIIHEIAHAIVGSEFGHRLEWQTKALELGLTVNHIKRYQI